jgi:hypothetical protein
MCGGDGGKRVFGYKSLRSGELSSARRAARNHRHGMVDGDSVLFVSGSRICAEL